MKPLHSQLEAVVSTAIINFCRKRAIFASELKVQGTVCVTVDTSLFMVAHIGKQLQCSQDEEDGSHGNETLCLHGNQAHGHRRKQTQGAHGSQIHGNLTQEGKSNIDSGQYQRLKCMAGPPIGSGRKSLDGKDPSISAGVSSQNAMLLPRVVSDTGAAPPIIEVNMSRLLVPARLQRSKSVEDQDKDTFMSSSIRNCKRLTANISPSQIPSDQSINRVKSPSQPNSNLNTTTEFVTTCDNVWFDDSDVFEGADKEFAFNKDPLSASIPLSGDDLDAKADLEDESGLKNDRDDSPVKVAKYVDQLMTSTRDKTVSLGTKEYSNEIIIRPVGSGSPSKHNAAGIHGNHGVASSHDNHNATDVYKVTSFQINGSAKSIHSSSSSAGIHGNLSATGIYSNHGESKLQPAIHSIMEDLALHTPIKTEKDKSQGDLECSQISIEGSSQFDDGDPDSNFNSPPKQASPQKNARSGSFIPLRMYGRKMSENQYNCNLCSNVYTTRGALKKHIDRHLGRSYPCRYCGHVFESHWGLSRHLRVEHRDKFQIKCHFCDEKFNVKKALAHHYRTQHGNILMSSSTGK